MGAGMLTYFKIGLDDEATKLLLDLSVVVGQSPRSLLARLVTDILIEDAREHGITASGRTVDVIGPRLN